MKSKQEIFSLIVALFTINALAVPAMATVKCIGDRVAVCQAVQEKTRTIAERAEWTVLIK